MFDRVSQQNDPALRTARLRLFATTDLHVHIMPYDYYGDRPSDDVGLAHTAALLETLSADADNTLLVDNGDFLQGTPLSDVIALERGLKSGELHPIIAAMNWIGYDAATLGNHEFNYGLHFLTTAIERADFPIVTANILSRRGAAPEQDTTFRPPWTILTRDIVMEDGGPTHQLKIGVIGFAPPQTVEWERLLIGDQIATRDILDAAEAQVPKLRAAGADIVVALCHSGIGPEVRGFNMENAAVPLAELPGIDVIVAGHTHMVFPGPDFPKTSAIDPDHGTLHGVPTVMPGRYGSHLGIVDLVLEATPDGWSVREHRSRAEPILTEAVDAAPAKPRVRPDARVIEIAKAAHADTLDFMRQQLGEVSAPLNSYFVFATPNPAIRLVADAQRRFAASLLARGPYEGRPLISAVSPFKAGGLSGPYSYVDIPAGPLSMRHAAELYLYPNTLCVLELTGAGLRDWLERSAGLFRTLVPGLDGQMLIDPKFACYNFDILDGLTYRFDLTQPPRYRADGQLIDRHHSRVRELGLHGKPVNPDDTYLVITNSYRAGGGGMFRAPPTGEIVASTALTARDVLVDHIRAAGVIHPEVRATWDFVPMPGTRVIYTSGVGAVNHMPVSFTHLGSDEDGFERFEMSL